MKVRYLLLFVFLFFVLNLFSQRRNVSQRTWGISVDIGSTSLWGDITSQNVLNQAMPVFGFRFDNKILKPIRVYVSFQKGWLRGFRSDWGTTVRTVTMNNSYFNLYY